MLFLIKKLFKSKNSIPKKGKKDYTKTKVLDDMEKILDWQYGQKGTEARDLYDAELEAVRRSKKGRNRAQS